MATRKKAEQVTVETTPEWKARLKRVCRYQNKSLSAYMRDIVSKQLLEDEQHIKEMEAINE